MTTDKLGVVKVMGHTMVTILSYTKTKREKIYVIPSLLHKKIKALKRMGRQVTLPDHPSKTTPMGHPHSCYGLADGCNQCVRCIMDYYADEVEEASQ